MTTATNPAQRGAQAAGPAIPMPRLIEVELRKMVDTRAGRWLLICTVGLVALVLGGILLAAGDDGDARSFDTLANVAQLPLLVLMPVIGVIAATTEWGQRTVLSTFSLVPSRGRVLAAKVGAALVLATVVTLLAFVLAAIAALIAPAVGTTNSDWGLGISNAGEMLVYQWLSMLLGVALGTALLSTPLAIVLYFALPTIWSGVVQGFKLQNLQLWLDTGTSWDRLMSDAPMTTVWWERVLTTALLWIVLPMAIGTWRVLRREVD